MAFMETGITKGTSMIEKGSRAWLERRITFIMVFAIFACLVGLLGKATGAQFYSSQSHAGVVFTIGGEVFEFETRGMPGLDVYRPVNTRKINAEGDII